MNERIQLLRSNILTSKRWASIEQAAIITKTYQENEQENVSVKRALAFEQALAQMKIAVEPGELIVGNRTCGIRAGVVFPESGSSWVDQEFETLPTRPQDTFEVHPEDIEFFSRKNQAVLAG